MKTLTDLSNSDQKGFLELNQVDVGDNEIFRDHLTKLYILAKSWALEAAAHKPSRSPEMEMAAYQSRINVLEATVAELQLLLTEKQLESDRFLSYLHEAQEIIESNSIRDPVERDSTNSRTRLLKILKKEAAYIEADHFSLNSVKIDGRAIAHEWNLSNFILNDNVINVLRFNLITENGLSSIEFLPAGEDKRTTSTSPYHVFCPEKNALIRLLPQNGGAYTGTNVALSSLSITAWAFLKDLIAKIQFFICSPEAKNYLPEDEIVPTRQGLDHLSLILKQWPEVFRYEKISLEDLQIDKSGKTIEIRLEHAGINDHRWDTVSFSITSTKSNNGQLEPRISFQKNKMPNLSYWQNMTEVADNEILDIRFASPDDIDAEMWERLEIDERMLVAGILSTTSHQLNTISSFPHLASIDWSEWHMAAQVMIRILRKYQASFAKPSGINKVTTD